MDAPRCRQCLEVPTQPLRSLAALPPLFAGRIRMTNTQDQVHNKKYIIKFKNTIKETGRRVTFFTDLPNLYLMEVKHIKNRIHSLQCEGIKSDFLKTDFSYSRKKLSLQVIYTTFLNPKWKTVALFKPKKENIAK